MKHQILLDTDIGSDVDDALALLYALKSDNLELGAVTTVYGKTDIRAKLAKRLVDLAGENIPVYAGESQPMRGLYPEIWHTGREGEGVLTQEGSKYTSLEEFGIERDAPGALIRNVMDNKGKYNIVAIGCLTNIARALQREPRVARYAKHLYIMGGDLRSRNPEHNIACDVDAAKVVFKSKIPKTLVPLNITRATPIKRQEFEILEGQGPVEEAVKNLVDVWFDYRDKTFKKHVGYTCMHDPLTLALIDDPALVEKNRTKVKLNSYGATIAGKGRKIDLCTGVHAQRFRSDFLSTLS